MGSDCDILHWIWKKVIGLYIYEVKGNLYIYIYIYKFPLTSYIYFKVVKATWSKTDNIYTIESASLQSHS